jgi:predicted dehydrogenase
MIDFMAKALVIGYGSIGKRHARNLSALGFSIVVKTDYPDQAPYSFTAKVTDANFDLAVIASPTARHLDDLTALAEIGVKKILLEKPIEINVERAQVCREICEKANIECSIAYNLRFHPLIRRLKDIVDRRRNEIRVVKISAGSYLPSWRPGHDYSRSYSARKNLGGGVQLDLSHEIDYMLWVFGAPLTVIHRHLDKVSSLAIDTFDYFKGLFRYDSFLIDLDMDYFRKNERYIQILGEDREICRIDLVHGTMNIDGEPRGWDDGKPFAWNDMYVDEIRDMLLPAADRKNCTLEQAVGIMEIIGPS